jgi:hypothetical protein
MPVETGSLFSRVIQDHLELKRKNSDLEVQMPIDRYKAEDPFDNHPLFKTEEQARLEDTLNGVEPEVLVHAVGNGFSWPGEDTHGADDEDSGLWTRSRDFDWGD